MALLIHPRILSRGEIYNSKTQQSFSRITSNTTDDNKHTRILEAKPALLVVTDIDGNILLSMVGVTRWSESTPVLGPDHLLTPLMYRKEIGEATTDFGTMAAIHSLLPIIPALDFIPKSAYTETIRQSGTAAKAFLIVDTHELYSQSSASAWPVALWDGSVPFVAADLAANMHYLEVSVGDLASEESLRLTSLVIDMDNKTVQMADAIFRVYFTNMLHDWTGMRDELNTLLALGTSMGIDQASIEAKEAAALAAQAT